MVEIRTSGVFAGNWTPDDESRWMNASAPSPAMSFLMNATIASLPRVFAASDGRTDSAEPAATETCVSLVTTSLSNFSTSTKISLSPAATSPSQAIT